MGQMFTFSVFAQPEGGWDARPATQWARIELAAERFGVTVHDPPMVVLGREWYTVSGKRAVGFASWLSKLSTEPLGVRVERWPGDCD